MIPEGPRLKEFEHLLNPQISDKADQNMIVVEVKGDPGVVAGQAIGLLMKAYYKQDGVKKSFSIPAVRARWPHDVDTPMNEWVGLFAIPIPNSITSLTKVKNPDSLSIQINKWDYGKVAEILHVGPYDTETATIEKLKKYISAQGYTITGMHEEEYLKGPGMFFKGNPYKYMTIIRYQVTLSDKSIDME